jgi:hypothetical protein
MKLFKLCIGPGGMRHHELLEDVDDRVDGGHPGALCEILEDAE